MGAPLLTHPVGDPLIRRVLDRAPVGGGAEPAWAVSTVWTPDTNSEAWNGYTMRQLIPASAIEAGTQMRLTLTRSAFALAVVDCYVGEAAAAGDPYDFAATPVRVLFSGANGFSYAADTGPASVVTDAIALETDGTKNIIVSFNFGAQAGFRAISTDKPGWVNYYKAGADAATVNAAGYSTSVPDAALVTKVEQR